MSNKIKGDICEKFENYITQKYNLKCINITDLLNNKSYSHYIKEIKNNNDVYICKQNNNNIAVFKHIAKYSHKYKLSTYLIFYKTKYAFLKCFDSTIIDNILKYINEIKKIIDYITQKHKLKCIDITQKLNYYNYQQYDKKFEKSGNIYICKKNKNNVEIFDNYAKITYNHTNNPYMIFYKEFVVLLKCLDTDKIDELLKCNIDSEDKIELNKINDYIVNTYKLKCEDISYVLNIHNYGSYVDKANNKHDIAYICKKNCANIHVFDMLNDDSNTHSDAIYLVIYRDDYILMEMFKQYYIDNVFNRKYNICNICFEVKDKKHVCTCGFKICYVCMLNMRIHDLLECPQCKIPMLETDD